MFNFLDFVEIFVFSMLNCREDDVVQAWLSQVRVSLYLCSEQVKASVLQQGI